MGCNAWNHSSNCTCGWGGDGHLGRRTLFSDLVQSSVQFKTYRDLLRGFTNPNAKCPVCGCQVFFYASPYGGRVFFDELGPPWPKHPCTDTGRSITILPVRPVQTHEQIEIFDRNGWVPFLCQDISTVRSDSTIFQLTGLVNDQKRTLFVRKEGISEGAPFLIKTESDGAIWLSTVLSTKNEIKADNFRAFEFESDLHTLLVESKPKKQKSTTPSRSRTNPIRSDQTPSINPQLSNTKPLLHRCNECFALVKNLERHITTAHTNQLLIQCPDCGASVKNLQLHFAKNHSPKAIAKREKLQVLNAKRRAEFKLQKSQKVQISKIAQKGRCLFCDFTSKSELALIAHLRAVHNKSPTALLEGKLK